MIRLVDLHPEWIVVGGRVVGISYDCPCCESFQISLLFANPPDGGPVQRQDGRQKGDQAGLRFRRSGDNFATLSIEEPILSSQAHHWSGRISSGEVSP